ncbi:MAG: RIP metalloprotease RseP [Anaerolineae bacterium]
MDFLLAVLSFIVVLGPIVIIHEWGHFIACRIVGVTVLEFGIGFPPRALKLFERNGTIFSLNWLPLGGFVMPLGEDFVRPVGEEATEKDRARYEAYKAELEALGKKVPKLKAVHEATPLQRMFFLFAGSGMNFIAAFVLLFLGATVGMPPISLGAAPNSPAYAAGLLPDDAIVEVNGKAVSTAEQINAEIEASGKAGQPLQLVVERDGERISLTIPLGTERWMNQVVRISDVSPNSPAEGKFQADDLILSIDGRRIGSVEGVQEYILDRAGQSLTFVLWRQDREVSVEVVPRVNPPAGQGAVGIGLIQMDFNPYYGFDVKDRATALTVAEAIPYAFEQTGEILVQLVKFPVDLIRGALTAEEARPVSAVGIAQLGGQVVDASIEDRSIRRILDFAALISIALGFTNLLPIPGLDGGRILFVLIEIVRGKPMAPEREGTIHFVGLMLLLGLFMVLVVNDIVNPLGQVIR